MPDHLGEDMRKTRPEEKEEEIKCKYFVPCTSHNPNRFKTFLG